MVKDIERPRHEENTMRSALRPLVVAATALAAAALHLPAAAWAPTELQPEDLPRGADIRVAHIEDGDLVVGERRVDVGGEFAHLLGRSGRSWMVGTSDADGQGGRRIVRVRPDDSIKVVKRGVSLFESVLSANGRFVVVPGRGTERALPIRVFSAATGRLRSERAFPHYPEVMAMDGRRVILSSWETGVRSWNIRTNTLSVITRKPANLLDVRNDLLAVYTKDPYRGGCVRLGRLSSPRTTLWRSCTERLTSISPGGTRMATIDLLADGLGPGRVWEREVDGTLLSHYATNWFGAIGFESNTALLLEVNGDTLSSTVRCGGGSCSNATDPEPVRAPRLSPSRRAGLSGSVAPGAGAWRTQQP